MIRGLAKAEYFQLRELCFAIEHGTANVAATRRDFLSELRGNATIVLMTA